MCSIPLGWEQTENLLVGRFEKVTVQPGIFCLLTPEKLLQIIDDLEGRWQVDPRTKLLAASGISECDMVTLESGQDYLHVRLRNNIHPYEKLLSMRINPHAILKAHLGNRIKKEVHYTANFNSSVCWSPIDGCMYFVMQINHFTKPMVHSQLLIRLPLDIINYSNSWKILAKEDEDERLEYINNLEYPSRNLKNDYSYAICKVPKWSLNS